jgi:hemoglobin
MRSPRPAPRFVTCFLLAAEDIGMPDDPGFRAALRSFIEWAADEVLSYSPPDSSVPERLPLRQCCWNGLG